MGANWGDIARDISKAAPLLGNLLPGVGTIAGAAVGGVAAIVASALGVPADPDSIQTALANDPDAYVKLRTAELDNKVALAQIALQQAQIGVQDLDSARKLAMAQPTDYTRQIITYLFLALVALIVVGMFFVPAAQALLKDNVGSLAVGTVIGYIFNELKQVLAFWFGATSDTSSSQQQITAAALSPGTVTTGNPAPAIVQAAAVQSGSPAPTPSPSNTDDSGTQVYQGS